MNRNRFSSRNRLTRGFLLAVLPRFGLGLGLALAASGCSLGSSTQVTGYVQSVKTDAYDTPTDISLFDGKDEYEIEKNDQQKALIDLVNRKISAQGNVNETWGGKKQIEIESFEVKD